MPLYRNTYWSKAIQVRDRETGQPQNISLWQFSCDVKDAAGAAVLTATSAGGHFVVFDGANGWFRFLFLAATNSTFPLGTIRGAVLRTDASPGPIRLGLFEETVSDLP